MTPAVRAPLAAGLVLLGLILGGWSQGAGAEASTTSTVATDTGPTESGQSDDGQTETGPTETGQTETGQAGIGTTDAATGAGAADVRANDAGSNPDASRPAELEANDTVERPATDGLIIIEEGDLVEAPPAEAPVTGALGRLWGALHVAVDSELFGYVQRPGPEDAQGRALGSAWLETRILPASNLSVALNGFARLAVDGDSDLRTQVILDVNEAAAKINMDRTTVTLGRLVVPWGRTQVAALGDRLNPPDHRRAPAFPDLGRQRQPMWGAIVRSSLGSVGLEAAALARYEASEGSLAAANQGGARIARYQTAIVRSPARAAGLLALDDTASLRDEARPFGSTSLGVRASRRVGDLDLGASAVWGFDETPRLHLRPDVARALAAEYVAHRGGVLDVEPLPCDARSGVACVGGAGAIVHDRTTSFAADASWGLGILILRAEVLAHPHVGALGGKSAIVVDDHGLRSLRTTQLAAALGVDGSLGDLLDGSLELFDVAWTDIPADTVLWGVEPFSAQADRTRDVHRVAAAMSVSGALLEDRLAWRVRGEAGINSLDALVALQVRYRLPVLGLYAGGRAEVFAGAAGTPGWLRQDATLVGVFVGEGS